MVFVDMSTLAMNESIATRGVAIPNTSIKPGLLKQTIVIPT